MVVSGNDALGNIQKQDIGLDVRLLPFGHNPLFVIHRHDMIGATKVGYIDVAKPVKQEKMKMSRTSPKRSMFKSLLTIFSGSLHPSENLDQPVPRVETMIRGMGQA